MFARWLSTVRGERCSLRAISTLVCPSAISRRTSTSRAESASSVSARCSASRRAAIRGLTNSSPRAAARTAAGSSSSASSLATNAERARSERALRERRVLVHRHHHDLRVGRPLAQPADRLDTRPARHVQIEHQHMRLVTDDVPCYSRHVIRFGDHVHTVLAVEQHPQASGASARDHRPAPHGSARRARPCRASPGPGASCRCAAMRAS